MEGQNYNSVKIELLMTLETVGKRIPVVNNNFEYMEYEMNSIIWIHGYSLSYIIYFTPKFTLTTQL